MLTLLNYRLRIHLLDGRMLVGQLLAFDRHMNLVLAECEEFRKLKIKGSKEGERREREEKRMLGLLVLRGEIIVNFTIEAPPPFMKEADKKVMVPTNGPGVARPAGRGTLPPSTTSSSTMISSNASISLTGGPGPMSSMPAPPGLIGPGRIGGPSMMPPPNGPGGAPMGRPPFPPPPPGWRPGMPLPSLPGMPNMPPPPGMPGMPPLTSPSSSSSSSSMGPPPGFPGMPPPPLRPGMMMPPMPPPPGFRPPMPHPPPPSSSSSSSSSSSNPNASSRPN